jgi:PAS domain S-box-containing protein
LQRCGGFLPGLPRIGDDAEVLNFLRDKFVDPEEFSRRVLEIKEHTSESFSSEVELKDGRILERITTPMMGEDGKYCGRVTYVRDITQRKQTEREQRVLNTELERRVEERTAQLHASEQSLRSIFDATPTPMLIMAPSMDEILMANEGIARITGHPLQDLFGVSARQKVFSEQDAAHILKGVASSGRVVGYELSIQGGKSGVKWYVVSISKVHLAEREVLVTGFYDITHRKEAEAVLEKRQDLLSQANAELERGLRIKDEFVANMSHELRTPLSAILNTAELLKEKIPGPLNPKQDRYIESIAESGYHLLNMINDILDLSKIEAGMISLEIELVDLRTICEAGTRMIKEISGKKGIQLIVDYDDGVKTIRADGRRLKQVLVNLLSNAVKFTPSGKKVGLEIRGNREDHQVSFAVWDEGMGITESDMPRLFKPFVQLDARLSREFEGTGLGLTIVARIVRLHGGSVSVESTPGQGSRFTVVLPWDPEPVKPPEVVGHETAGLHATFSRSETPTVLIVDDTDTVTEVTRNYLEALGFKVIVAVDGPGGITAARQHHPDVILMDIQLPGLDGLEATRRLRMDAAFQSTPIIALTALAMNGDRERCLEAGMSEYVSKPVRLKQLADMIKRSLGG